MRNIEGHKAGINDDHITVAAVDEPGPDGANHEYVIEVKGSPPMFIRFQKGPLKEVGGNGLTAESLLAVVIDRLQTYQAGKFACEENRLALACITEGIVWLRERTRNRVKRGVEGTSQV